MVIEKDLSKCVKIKEVKQCVQRVVINGVEQSVNNGVFVICCPNCGRLITQLNQIPTIAIAHKFVSDNHNELLKETSYCPSCGQKLDYPVIINDEV